MVVTGSGAGAWSDPVHSVKKAMREGKAAMTRHATPGAAGASAYVSKRSGADAVTSAIRSCCPAGTSMRNE
jgi:DNA-binding NarL/FixJ family response regulator